MHNAKQSAAQTPQSVLKSMQTIHAALLAGQVMFAAVSYFVAEKTPNFSLKNTGDVFLYIVPLMAIGSFTAGNIVFKQKIASLPAKDILMEKLIGYLTALIIRFALLEGASLFGIVAFMLTGNLLFLLISVLLMLFMLTLRPSADKVATDLELSYEEKLELEAKDNDKVI
jgi:hypothetical protein